MRKHVDIQVIVLSTRSDLDLVISTWVPGYTAQRTTEVDVLAASATDSVPVVDLACSRSCSWVAELSQRSFSRPVVVIHARDGTEASLPNSVSVVSPPTVAGLLAAFEHVRTLNRSSRCDARPSDGGGAAPPGGGAESEGRALHEHAAEHARGDWPRRHLPRSARRGIRARWSLWRRGRQRTRRGGAGSGRKPAAAPQSADGATPSRLASTDVQAWDATWAKTPPRPPLPPSALEAERGDTEHLFGAHPDLPALLSTPETEAAVRVPADAPPPRSP